MILISRIRRCCSLVTVTTATALILNLSSLSLRARGIKPGFFTNDRLVGLDPLIRLLFIGAWQAADRRGLLEDRPMKLKIQILPADDCDVDDGLYQLQEAGFVLRYHDRKAPEKRYIKIISFPKHQNPHKDEKANEDIPEYDPKKHVISTRPAQSQHGANTVSATDQHQSKPADSWNLTPDSLLPDSSTFVNGTGPSTKKGATKVFGEDSLEFSLVVLLRDLILANRATAKVPDLVDGLARWCREMNLLLRVDRRDPLEVEKVIRWSQADSFWKTNILSPSSLRKHYDELAMKMEAGNNGKKQGQPSGNQTPCRTNKGSRGK